MHENGDLQMTNLRTIFGAGAWAGLATLLMLAALEPAPSPLSETQFAAVKVAVGFAEI